jgi:colicin import membrane protein
MQGFYKEHLRTLAGSVGLHLGLIGVLALAALRWTSQQPPVELAIQGYVVDGPVKVRPLPNPSRSPVEPTPRPVEQVRPPEPAAEPPPEPRAEEVAAAERAAEAAREQQLVAESAARERDAQVAREKAAAEQRRAEEAERKRAADAEVKRRADEKTQADREAKARAEREADLQRRLAAEEEEGAAAAARAGVMDEYRLMLVQAIERNWIRPPSARTGLECTLYVSQAPGGSVVDVKLGACNGDQLVRESITTAVYKSSPLPAPRDPRAFERRLEIVFRPTE